MCKSPNQPPDRGPQILEAMVGIFENHRLWPTKFVLAEPLPACFSLSCLGYPSARPYLPLITNIVQKKRRLPEGKQRL